MHQVARMAVWPLPVFVRMCFSVGPLVCPSSCILSVGSSPCQHTTLPPLLLSSLRLSFDLIISVLLIKATLLRLCTSSANKMHRLPLFTSCSLSSLFPSNQAWHNYSIWPLNYNWMLIIFSPSHIFYHSLDRSVMSSPLSFHHLRRCGSDYSLTFPPIS